MLTKYINKRLLFWDALIGAVGGLFGDMANVQAQQDINAQNISFAKEMYAQQRSDALADREHMEQYNDPSSQMQRLANAGLNPHLVFGSGHAVNTVNTLPHQATANMPNLQAPRINPDMLNIAQVLANIDLAKSQAKKNLADAGKSESETKGQDLQNEFNQRTTDLRFALLSNENHKVLREISKIDNDIMINSLLANKSLQYTEEQIKTLSQARLYQIKEYDLRLWEIGENLKIALRKVAADENQAQAALMHGQASLKSAAADMLRALDNHELTTAEAGAIYLDILYKQAYTSEYSAQDKAINDYISDKYNLKGLKMRFDYSDGINKFRQGLRDWGSLIPFTNFR